MKLLLISCLLILVITSLNAQDFRTGFIIKVSGDSIGGFVENNTSKENSKVCYFKAKRGAKKVAFLPSELKGYGVIDYKYFKSKEIKLADGQKKTVFLEALVKGKASLYSYVDSYYLETDSVFLLPRPTVKEVYRENASFLKKDARYIGLINIAMANCGLKADNTAYEEKDLTYLVQNYNRCLGKPGIILKAKNPWTKINFSLLAAWDQMKLDLEGVENFSVKPNVSLPFGAGIELSSPKLTDKVYFVVELWYIKKFFQGYQETNSGSSTTRSDIFLYPTFLKVPLSIKYNFLQEDNTPYFKVGISQYFVSSFSGTLIMETESSGMVTTDRRNLTFEKPNQTGFWIGAGYSKRFSHYINAFAEVRYERSNGFVNTAPYSKSTSSVLDIVVGLKF